MAQLQEWGPGTTGEVKGLLWSACLLGRENPDVHTWVLTQHSPGDTRDTGHTVDITLPPKKCPCFLISWYLS